MNNGYEYTSEQSQRLIAEFLREQTKEAALAKVRMHQAARKAKVAELRRKYLAAQEQAIKHLGRAEDLPLPLRGLLIEATNQAMDPARPLKEQHRDVCDLIDTLKRMID